MGNFDKLHDHLIRLQHKFDIVGLSETWNSSSNRGNFKPGTLAGCHTYLGTTRSSLKSGCGLYINNNLKFKERNDLKFSFFDDENEFQSKWVEIIYYNIIVGILLLETLANNTGPGQAVTVEKKQYSTVHFLLAES